jgi:putative transposase
MVDHLRDQYRASERHACQVLLMVRGTYRYQSHREPWTELRMRIREIAQSRVRYGYRKIRVLLNREGWDVGKYLVYRLYKEEGLALKKRPKRKRKAARDREERFVATAPNQAWSVDFVADQLQDGTRFRALTMLDVYTRESVAIEVGQRLKGDDVVRVLNRMKRQRGVPKVLFCDNGSEFTSQAMDLWAYQSGMKIDFSRPGKPTDNAFIESFNGTFRAECLNAHWFGTLAEAKRLIEAWRQEYNESRPHRSLSDRTPNEFATECRPILTFEGRTTAWKALTAALLSQECSIYPYLCEIAQPYDYSGAYKDKSRAHFAGRMISSCALPRCWKTGGLRATSASPKLRRA